MSVNFKALSTSNYSAIPVIADPSVNREFGTGAVKVTPAHDKRDFEMARRHSGLTSPITMLDEAGCVTNDFPDFAGSLPRNKICAFMRRARSVPYNTTT